MTCRQKAQAAQKHSVAGGQGRVASDQSSVISAFDFKPTMNTSTAVIDYSWVSKWRFWLSCAVSIVFLTVGVSFLCLEHVG
jgi:hypothetical protein